MRRADIIVALLLMLVGIIVVIDANRLGYGWGVSGPQAGFFPFYMGLGVVICTAIVALKGIIAYREQGAGKPVVHKEGFKQILWVLIPAIGMVLVTELVGLHVATIIYLIFYMRAVGKIEWVKVVLVSILLPLATYILFDKLFLIPLPDGLWGKYILRF